MIARHALAALVVLLAVLTGDVHRNQAAAQPATLGPAPVATERDAAKEPDTFWSDPAPGTIALPVAASGEGVIVRGEAGLDVLASHVAGLAPAALARMHDDLAGLPRPRRVEIRLVKQARDLGAAAPRGRGAPEWASGVAYPASGVVVVAVRRGAELIDVDNVVEHELAHLALGAALRGRAPRWLDEGFAFLHAPELSLDRVQILTGMVWFNGVIPLAELDRAFFKDSHEVDRAYAQSYDLTAFLARRGRYADRDDDGDHWPFRRLLANLAAGLSVADAALDAYSATPAMLFGEWQDDLRERYLLLPSGLFGLGVWAIAAVLLVIAFVRRRRRDHRVLTRWADEEEAIPEVDDDPMTTWQDSKRVLH